MISDLLRGALAGVAAVLAMAVVAAAGLTLLGPGLAALPDALALAVGATADVRLGPRLSAVVDGMPLGVTLTGAAVLALTPRLAPTWAGAAGAGVAFLAVLAAFSPRLATLGAGAVWLLAVLALSWLCSRRAPVPAVVSPVVAGWVRPVLSAACAVLLTLAAVTVAGGLSISAVNRPLAAGLLLAGPNLVCAILSAGAGVAWSLEVPFRFGGELMPAPAVTATAFTVVAAVIALMAVRRAGRLLPAVAGMAVLMGVLPLALAWFGGLSVSARFLSFGVTARPGAVPVLVGVGVGGLTGLCAHLVRTHRLEAVRTGRAPVA